MALSDILEGMSNPEAYILKRVKQSEDPNDQVLAQNLYASGYEGQPPTGITQPRGMIGSALEGLGILGPSPDRKLTPYEQFLVDKGREGKSNADIAAEGKRLEIQSYKDKSQLGKITGALSLLHTTGVLPTDDLIPGLNEIPGAQDQLLGLSKMDTKARAEKATIDRLKTDEERAKIRYYMSGLNGTRPGGKTPEEKAIEASKKQQDLLAKVLQNNSNLNTEYNRFVFGDPKDSTSLPKFVKLVDPNVPATEKHTIVSNYLDTKARLRAAAIQAGIDPTFVDGRFDTAEQDWAKPFLRNPLDVSGPGVQAKPQAVPGATPGVSPGASFDEKFKILAE